MLLTDRGTEYCGTDAHEYELYLAVEAIDHTRTKAKGPESNGICERFHKTVLNEFYRVSHPVYEHEQSMACQRLIPIHYHSSGTHRPG